MYKMRAQLYLVELLYTFYTALFRSELSLPNDMWSTYVCLLLPLAIYFWGILSLILSVAYKLNKR